MPLPEGLTWPFKGMNWKTTTPSKFADQLGTYLLKAIGDTLAEALAVRDAKIKSLQEELAARNYMGVHDPAKSYRKHNMATSGGCLWIAVDDSPGVPGQSPGWKLAVKKGRDARD